jgi:exodeoxyribonuclease VII, large subunit
MSPETSYPVGEVPVFSVAQAVATFNQILDAAVPLVEVVGEVASFKVNQGKWVFFDLKDQECLLSCFMPVYQLRVAVEDGMQVQVLARPNVAKWGKFSLTVQSIRPVGKGSIKKSFELLRRKLADEGLFDDERKRILPYLPQHIGVISSVDAAGYRDFTKIITARLGGLRIDVISTLVQGAEAPDQIIAAIRQFNQLADPPEVLAIIRGGGSRDDLVAFDDERLVRTIAASRIPTIVGVGHEIDTTLADLVADRRASTPSNAAEVLVPDRQELTTQLEGQLSYMTQAVTHQLTTRRATLASAAERLGELISYQLQAEQNRFGSLKQALQAYDPQAVLRRGYAMLWDSSHHPAKQFKTGDKLLVETTDKLIKTEVRDVQAK